MGRLFALGGQRIEASATVLPMNIQGWSPFRLTGLISLQSKELSRVFSSTTVRKHQFYAIQSSLRSNFPHSYMTTGRNHSFDSMDLCRQMMSLLFNTEVCRILPSKEQVSFNVMAKVCHSLLSKEQMSFNVMATITICSDFGTPNIVSITASTLPLFYLPWSDGNKCQDLSFF